MRPTLLPGLRRLWRDRHAVQLGTDPRRAVVLEFADPGLARVLDLLDGSRTEQTVLRDAATLGIAEPAAAALLDTLRDSGLAVEVRDDAAVLGPLVPPAGSPCLNCLDLHRREHDPAWPALAAQLSTGPEGIAPLAVTTVLTVTAYAVDEVLAYLDGRKPQTIGTTIELTGPGREARRAWSPHPGCECTRGRRHRASQADEVQ